MSRIRCRAATAILALAVVACSSSAPQRSAEKVASRTSTSSTTTPLPQAHPQVVQPVAGDAGARHTTSMPIQAAPPPPPGHDPAPTGPATDTSAPAPGAPTDAEVRAAVAKFKQAVARYHLNRLNFSNVLLDPSQLPAGQWYTSIASVYTDYGRGIACGGVLRVPQLGVANKTLPCGTEVTFVYGGRAIRVPVIDRGPYIAGREWDLTGATAEALHFPGLGPIQWRIG